MVHTDFWDKERADMDIDRGPCTHCTTSHFLAAYADYQIGSSALEYIRAPALRGIAWIEKHAKTVEHDSLSMPSRNLYPPEEHVSVIQRYSPLAPHLLPADEELLRPFLWHADFRTPNIFMGSEGNITSIIDWQSSWAAPLFSERRLPKFLEYKGEMILELPENFKDLDNDGQASIEEQMTKSLILCLYEKHTAERNPILYKMFKYPEGPTLTAPIQYPGSTWNGDVLILREALIRVQK